MKASSSQQDKLANQSLNRFSFGNTFPKTHDLVPRKDRQASEVMEGRDEKHSYSRSEVELRKGDREFEYNQKLLELKAERDYNTIGGRDEAREINADHPDEKTEQPEREGRIRKRSSSPLRNRGANGISEWASSQHLERNVDIRKPKPPKS